MREAWSSTPFDRPPSERAGDGEAVLAPGLAEVECDKGGFLPVARFKQPLKMAAP
jgi:hypothetical protein